MVNVGLLAATTMSAWLGRLGMHRKQSSSALVTTAACEAIPHALQGNRLLFIWFSLWFASLIPLFLKVVLHPGGRASSSPCPLTSLHPLSFLCSSWPVSPLRPHLAFVPCLCAAPVLRVPAPFALSSALSLPLLCGWPSCQCLLSSSDSHSSHFLNLLLAVCPSSHYGNYFQIWTDGKIAVTPDPVPFLFNIFACLPYLHIWFILGSPLSVQGPGCTFLFLSVVY